MAVRPDIAASSLPIDVAARRARSLAEDDAAWARATRPMVERIAARFARRLPPSLSTEDLVAAGFVALIEMKRRHPTLPVDDLERLGACRVRGAMLDEMRKGDPLSRRTRQRAKRIEQVTVAFEARAGRAPSEAELAAALGVSQAATATARRVARSTVALGCDGDAIEHVPSTSGLSPEDATHRGERLTRFHRAVDTLPDRQRRIVALYFGDDQTLRQIGEQFGVTEARISQLLSGAVKELRQSCASMPPPAA